MLMVKLWILPVLLFAATAISCSMVEEDRDDCPCWYTIDLTEVDGRVANLQLWLFDKHGKLILNKELQGAPYGKCEVMVKRGSVVCSVWGNVSQKSLLHNDGTINSCYSKADSCSSDPLFNYVAVVDAGTDAVYDTVRLTKEYAAVDFTLKGSILEGGPYELAMRMNTAGRQMNGDFVLGESSIFSSHSDASDGEYRFMFNMMRQKSIEELEVTLLSLADGGRRVVMKFPFGKWLVTSGYDADAPDMEDITMVLDLATGSLYVKTEDWQTLLPVRIEI